MVNRSGKHGYHSNLNVWVLQLCISLYLYFRVNISIHKNVAFTTVILLQYLYNNVLLDQHIFQRPVG